MKRKALILITAASLFLGGCSTVNAPRNTVKSTESSKEDISPSTGKSENTSVETTTSDTTINETNNVHSSLPVIAEINLSTFTPVSQNAEIAFTLYTPNSNADGLDTQTIMLPGDEVVFSILVAHNIINSNVTLNYLNESIQYGKKTLALDLSTAFISQLDSSGSSQAQLTIASIVNTYLNAYNANKILITSGGDYLQGAHYDLTHYQYYTEINRDMSSDAIAITIYLYDDYTSSFDFQTINVDSITASSVIQSLSQAGILDSAVAVNAFNEIDNNGEKILTLDLNDAFVSLLQRQGSSGIITINKSLTNTFLNNFGADKMQVTVNGVPPIGEHYDYSEYMTYY